MSEIAILEVLWRFLPAVLLVPFITFFLGRLGNNKERKLEYRTFFHAIETLANYKLTNDPTLKNGTKHLLPHQFLSAKKIFDDRVKNPQLGTIPQILYLRLNVFGKSILTGCHIHIEIENEDEDFDIDVALSVIAVEEQIFIPLDSLEMIKTGMRVREIKIKYTTQAGEKMIFESIRNKNKDGDYIFIDKHSVRFLWFFNIPISSTRGPDTPMILLKEYKS